MPRILVVDDQPDIRLLLHGILKGGGHEVRVVPGGRDAIDLLGSGVALPDLVVLDIQMPGVDGWDVLRHVRANPDLTEVPVVLCTVKASLRDLLEGWEQGCDGYVTKPFDIDDLIDEVAAVLRRTPAERVAHRVAERLRTIERIHRLAPRR
ncbi:MAG: response regulator [Actinomycetota bacterium]